MFTYKVGISAQEHDQFAKASNQTNLLQSSNWAQVKDNWDNERLGFYQDDKLVASASILIKRLPLGMTMLYVPRGPIMDYQNQEVVDYVIKSLKNTVSPSTPSLSNLIQPSCSRPIKLARKLRKILKH